MKDLRCVTVMGRTWGDMGAPPGGIDKWDCNVEPAGDGRETCAQQVRGTR